MMIEMLRSGLLFLLGLHIQAMSVNAVSGTKPLRIGIEGNNAPLSFYEYSEATITGFDVEMAREACHRLGLEPVFVNTYWHRVFRDLQEQRIDLVWSGMALTPERQALYSTSIPYHQTEIVIVVNQHSSIHSLEQLRSARIGYLADSRARMILQEHPLLGPEIERERIHLIPHSSFLNGFVDLAFSRVDALAIEDYAVFSFALLPPEKVSIRILPKKLGKYDFGIAARPADTLLIRQLDSALTTMENDGTTQRLRQIWFNPVFFQRLQNRGPR